MSIPDVDLQAQSQKRITGAMARSARFRAVVSAIVAGFTKVKEALQSIDRMLDIDTQGGVVLDIIGALVGQPRRLIGAAPRSFFGFKIESPGSFQRSLPYGDRAHTDRGGVLWNRGASLTAGAFMDDATYRFAIRARIIKNNLRPDGEPWIEKLYRSLLLILPDANLPGPPVVHVFPLFATRGRMQITVCIGRPLSSREVALLTQADLLPIPDGVLLQFTQWDDTKPVMGFKGQQRANVAGYGDRAHPTRGGRLAERVSQNVAR